MVANPASSVGAGKGLAGASSAAGSTIKDTLNAGLGRDGSAAADARVLFPSADSREALRLLAGLGPRLVYLAEQDGGVWLREGGRVHWYPAQAGDDAPRDRYAGPAAFWVALAQRSLPKKAAADSVRYAQSVRRAGAPRQAHASLPVAAKGREEPSRL